ncbi:uroporphyrinogen-III synthase [Salibacterium halotolerans]|uniref:Uroporphyrinogen-III synthase n=1 Tax=Salibacterium halotolerans TaxID=1884432 RepID=A0A1I5QFM7_9BACI|nr:uroporphyrinogen-III synthase [Salibacterium halotolerans]SFP45043.1 uroporphyrinogen-III synthase [Salibacterium halotolerans]
MTGRLTGKKVMIAASRKTEEMTTLIEKQGGEAFVHSLQGTTFPAEEEVKNALQHVIDREPDWYIFMTGMGTASLLEWAEKTGSREAFITSVKRASVGARGYKTAASLKQMELVPDVRDDDGTIDGLIRVLASKDFSQKKVAVQLHGIQAPKLNAFLYDRGAASVEELYPYKHAAPKDNVLRAALNELLAGEYDAVCFTTQMQVHSLFRYAEKEGKKKELMDGFSKTILAAAVGKVTAEALEEEGVTRMIVPEPERMGAMMMELGAFYS